MKLSQLKIERQLSSAFIFYLKNNGYVCLPSKNKQQPFIIYHTETPDMTHIIEIDNFGHWKIPELLRNVAMEFSKHSAPYTPIKKCVKCEHEFNVVAHNFYCPECKEIYIPF
ncbi:conserved hypothetical protein [Vibrio chagasii]|nr:conserved hypothetical protein [Vibrio chagasii]